MIWDGPPLRGRARPRQTSRVPCPGTPPRCPPEPTRPDESSPSPAPAAVPGARLVSAHRWRPSWWSGALASRIQTRLSPVHRNDDHERGPAPGGALSAPGHPACQWRAFITAPARGLTLHFAAVALRAVSLAVRVQVKDPSSQFLQLTVRQRVKLAQLLLNPLPIGCERRAAEVRRPQRQKLVMVNGDKTVTQRSRTGRQVSRAHPKAHSKGSVATDVHLLAFPLQWSPGIPLWAGVPVRWGRRFQTSQNTPATTAAPAAAKAGERGAPPRPSRRRSRTRSRYRVLRAEGEARAPAC